MKKILAVVLSLLMMVSLCACAVTEEPEFTEVNETVYVVGVTSVFIRKGPSTDSEKVGSLKEGESITRIGIGDEWSKVLYNDQECYIASNCLSTTKPTVGDDLEFIAVDETIYVKAGETIKIRSTPDTNTETNVVATANEGDSVRRIGYLVDGTDDNGDPVGWSKVEYTDKDGNKQIGYTRSWYWTTEQPDIPADTNAG